MPAANEAAAVNGAPKNDVTGLPTFLLPVPGGKTWIGMTADQLVKVACQAINPRRPEEAAKAPEKVTVKLKNTASALGRTQVEIPTFLLGKWPVTNKEYAVYIETMRAQGEKIRPPFHWWRYGRKDDYDKKLEDIQKLFPKDGAQGPVLYWSRYGEELPFALKDDQGKPIDDLPVVFVSHRDAVRFAGWLGMRLPREEEWTRAARGDSDVVWPWGNDREIGDRWDEDVLRRLGIANLRDRRLQPVGTAQFAYGPFGHFDMTGQVWELMAERGFGRLTPGDFHAEWKKLQKDSLGKLLQEMPGVKEDRVVVKGASYLSAGDPVQFIVDSRVALQTIDVLESVGFRLAKSLKPGYDMLYSLIQSDYEQGAYAPDQAPDLALQVGAERYELRPDGFPEKYHAVSFAPANWITDEKNVSVNKLEEQSQYTPLVLGVFATTEAMLEPKLHAGIFTVGFRAAGKPRELVDALKQGCKEVAAAQKRKDRGEKEEEQPAEGKQGKNDWRTVLARFGLTEKDLEGKDVTPEKIDFVRVGELQVPTETGVLLFRDNDGKWVGFVRAKVAMKAGTVDASTLAFAPRNVAGGARAGVDFLVRVPMQKGQKRAVELPLHVVLDQAPPAADQVWRLP